MVPYLMGSTAQTSEESVEIQRVAWCDTLQPYVESAKRRLPPTKQTDHFSSLFVCSKVWERMRWQAALDFVHGRASHNHLTRTLRTAFDRKEGKLIVTSFHINYIALHYILSKT